MANHKTGAQRYNDRMDKIFDRAKKEGRGLIGNSHTKGAGVNSPAMMKARQAALNNKKDKSRYSLDSMFGGNPIAKVDMLIKSTKPK